MQQAARSVLDNDPQKLSDEQITEMLLEFEGNLAHLDRVREKFHHDLASVELTALSRSYQAESEGQLSR